MMLFLHLWPTAKEEISSLFQISYAKPVFPMQSISPWSPVSAKHNCILSWALISKIEIISKIASARGPLPCWHVLQQSSLTERFKTAGIRLCWAVRWFNLLFGTLEISLSVKLPTPLSMVGLNSVEVPVLMFLEPQVAARKRFLQVPEVTDHALVLLRLWEALPCWAIVLSCTYKPTCKWGIQIPPVCTGPSESCCNSPVPSSAFPPPSEPITLTRLPGNLRSKVEASENLLHRWCFTYNSHENVSATGAKYIYKVLKIMTECALPASHRCIVIGDKYESMVNVIYLTSFADYQ